MHCVQQCLFFLLFFFDSLALVGSCLPALSVGISVSFLKLGYKSPPGCRRLAQTSPNPNTGSLFAAAAGIWSTDTLLGMRRYRGDLREPCGDILVNREQDGASKISSRDFGYEPQLAVDVSSNSSRMQYRSELEEGDWPMNREQGGVGKGGGAARPARPTPISADFVGVSDACRPKICRWVWLVCGVRVSYSSSIYPFKMPTATSPLCCGDVPLC